MSEREKIIERLKKKEMEIQNLEDRLRSARIYVQALQDVLKLLGDTSPNAVVPGDAILKVGSAMDQVRKIILSRDSPVHIAALLEALGKDSSRESQASLAGSLAAYVRRGQIFSRPAPNTFGLLELGHSSLEDVDEGQPPSGFGKVSRPTRAPAPPPDEDIPF